MKKIKFEPDWLVHPCDTINDCITNKFTYEERSFDNLSKIMLMPKDVLSMLLNGKIAISSSIAEKLEVLGPKKEFWIKLQINFDQNVYLKILGNK